MTNYDALGHCFLTHKRSKVIVCPVSMQHVTSEDKGNFPLIYIYIYIYILGLLSLYNGMLSCVSQLTSFI